MTAARPRRRRRRRGSVAASCSRPIGGRPILQHVLDALAAAGVGDVVVVLGDDAAAIEGGHRTGATSAASSTPTRNAACRARCRSGSRRSGPTPSAVLVALGDQPLVSVDGHPGAARRAGRPRPADRRAGLSPTSAAATRSCSGAPRSASSPRRPAIAGSGRSSRHTPSSSPRSPVAGANPDVDTPADLARAIEASWAARVRANREQVERIREVPDGADFYAPVNSLFRADPTRTDDPVLDALLALVRSGRHVARRRRGRRSVRAADRPRARPVGRLGRSRSTRRRRCSRALREIAEDYAIENVRTVEARWPPADPRERRRLRGRRRAHRPRRLRHRGDRAVPRRARGGGRPALRRRPDGAGARPSAADPFWPPVHGEDAGRAAGAARPRSSCSRRAAVARRSQRIAIEPRRFESRDALGGVRPAPALDRPGRPEGGPVPGGARRADGRRTATAGRSRDAGRATSGS